MTKTIGIENHWKSKGLYQEHILVKQYQQERKIQTLQDLPSLSREKVHYYWKKAVNVIDHPGEWWLAGSYVTGSYIDHTTPKEVIRAFSLMGIKPAFESDVDFYVPGFRGVIRRTFFDIIGFNRKGENKILLGMAKKTEQIQVITIPPIVNDLPSWDWSKFPEEDIPQLQKAFKEDDQSTMITLHNRHKLSTNSFCCNGGKVLLYNVEQFLKSIEDETV